MVGSASKDEEGWNCGEWQVEILGGRSVLSRGYTKTQKGHGAQPSITWNMRCDLMQCGMGPVCDVRRAMGWPSPHGSSDGHPNMEAIDNCLELTDERAMLRFNGGKLPRSNRARRRLAYQTRLPNISQLRWLETQPERSRQWWRGIVNLPFMG